MCGIAGVISSHRQAIEPAVRRMMQAMVHRGPDDEGYERLPLGCKAGPEAGFGFRRLAIMDLSAAGHQPMVNRATGDCLIFNGEIYNFRWLRAKLESQGVKVRSTGDTEVLLHALSKWGEQTLDSLDGMFAFAFYQASTRRILLGRDPFGIKPLYIAHAPKAFVFASEVRAVLASGFVPDDLDPAGIATMLAYGAPQDPLTVHRTIRSFPAGSCQWLEAEVATGRVPPAPRRYWCVPETDADISEADAVQKIRQQLNASVRDQCISDVPIGVFLSGGIDSATIAALAAKHSSGLHTYSIGFEATAVADETSAAEETAHAIGTIHAETILDDEWGALQFHNWLKASDRPSIDGLNTYVVSEVVKNRGATVALSGIGADELFGGYGSFRSIPRLRKWLHAVSWVPAGVRRAAASALLAGAAQTKREKAAGMASLRPMAMDLTLGMRRVLSDGALAAIGLSPAQVGLLDAYLPPSAYELVCEAGAEDFRTISIVESALYMGNTLLRDADANSMAHSLELRVPFLGRTISESALRFPGHIHAPPKSDPKYLLRHAMRDELPGGVFTRRKAGFTLPIGEWMMGSMKDACEAAVESLAGCSVVDGARVRSLWEAFMSPMSGAQWVRALALVALGNYLSVNRAKPVTLTS